MSCVFLARKKQRYLQRPFLFLSLLLYLEPSFEDSVCCSLILTYKGGSGERFELRKHAAALLLCVDLSHALYNCLVIFNPQFFQVITFLLYLQEDEDEENFTSRLVVNVFFLNCKNILSLPFMCLQNLGKSYEFLVREVSFFLISFLIVADVYGKWGINSSSLKKH